MMRRLVLSTLVALVLAVPVVLAQKPPASAKTVAIARLSEPWPEDDVLLARRTEAQSRKLFQDGPPIEFTLASEFNLINRERAPNNGKQFPGVLTVEGTDIPVKLGSRGHLRLNPRTCDFVPIRIELPADRIGGTIFEGQTRLKLGTHCRNERDFDQYVIREYLAYKLANFVTPLSFRARLARGTYIDARSKKPLATHSALFLEHENDVARRLGGRDVNLPHMRFKDLDDSALTTMMLLEYMLGNTDYSIWSLHNVVIVQNKKRAFFPVPYDFDLSGIVHPPYLAPDERLHQRNATDRLYRGPCRTVEEFNAAAEPFRAHKADMIAAIDSAVALNGAHKREMKDYLESFFRHIDSPESIRKTFVDGCNAKRARV
jgi:hypothetical protein